MGQSTSDIAQNTNTRNIGNIQLIQQRLRITFTKRRVVIENSYSTKLRKLEMDFRFLFIWTVSLVVVCNTAPSPPNDIDEDVASRYGVQGINQNHQNNRNPDTPRAPHQDPGRGCRWEYETKYEVKDVETTDQKCHVEYETKCTTRTREKCTPYTDRVCKTQYRQKCRNWTEKKCTDSWRNECSTRTKEECNEYNEPIDVPYTEDKRSTRKERKCEKHWEERVKGKKVWVDNPSTCKDYDVTDCQPVTTKRNFKNKSNANKFHTNIVTELKIPTAEMFQNNNEFEYVEIAVSHIMREDNLDNSMVQTFLIFETAMMIIMTLKMTPKQYNSDNRKKKLILGSLNKR